jgi:hypothetical protein
MLGCAHEQKARGQVDRRVQKNATFKTTVGLTK